MCDPGYELDSSCFCVTYVYFGVYHRGWFPGATGHEGKRTCFGSDLSVQSAGSISYYQRDPKPGMLSGRPYASSEPHFHLMNNYPGWL